MGADLGIHRMSDIVIKAESLGKKYVIGHEAQSGRYVALRDVLVHAARNMWHKTQDLIRGNPIFQGDDMEDVWAIRDLNFEIRQGEVIGIIGRNGSGKSTLLKILSRITEPSEGRVGIRGRVSSLLEVGTGFHPELTGRENIFLNGAILGMTRAEIKRKFDEIVAFAEIEKFLDTPVKRYSSGMYVRLAFAVAAHLEPEVLLVDEVLAVGDMAFQRKCIGKMEGVAREGRTVLFVSHDMAAIEALCTRCILLVDGGLKLTGAPHEVTNYYAGQSAREETGRRSLEPKVRKRPIASAMMTEVVVSTGNGVPAVGIPMGSPLAVHVLFQSNEPIHPVLGVVVKTVSGFSLFGACPRVLPRLPVDELTAEAVITCQFEDPALMPGKYILDLYFGDSVADLDIVKEAISFEVFPKDIFGTGKLPPPLAGPLIMPASWALQDPSLRHGYKSLTSIGWPQ